LAFSFPSSPLSFALVGGALDCGALVPALAAGIALAQPAKYVFLRIAKSEPAPVLLSAR
jgi:hypothetical protein